MKILVIGGGGREHALIWKLFQSPKISKIYCAPGNAGIESLAQCVPLGSSDLSSLLEFAISQKIDVTIVGPEQPLTLGIVDLFQSRGLKIFGPNKEASQFEGSKVFAKDFMDRAGIPTARFDVFEEPLEAREFIKKSMGPWVIKADGLASGKGVYICRTKDEALTAICSVMEDKIHGVSGTRVVIENFLEGEELSYLIMIDGKNYVPLASSQDHKALLDGDRGPNTGGMGAYSPAPLLTPDLECKIQEKIIKPFLKRIEQENIEYRGVLYMGLMIVKDEPYVLEFNVRFGDPETQPLMMRLDSDLLDLLCAVIYQKLDTIEIKWKKEHALCVVLASRGYPGEFQNGLAISGLEELDKDWVVFHSGTKREGQEVVTSGGRVLGVTSLGQSLKEAFQKVYEGIDKISWKGMFYRKDIGLKGMRLWM